MRSYPVRVRPGYRKTVYNIILNCHLWPRSIGTSRLVNHSDETLENVEDIIAGENEDEGQTATDIEFLLLEAADDVVQTSPVCPANMKSGMTTCALLGDEYTKKYFSSLLRDTYDNDDIDNAYDRLCSLHIPMALGYDPEEQSFLDEYLDDPEHWEPFEGWEPKTEVSTEEMQEIDEAIAPALDVLVQELEGDTVRINLCHWLLRAYATVLYDNDLLGSGGETALGSIELVLERPEAGSYLPQYIVNIFGFMPTVMMIVYLISTCIPMALGENSTPGPWEGDDFEALDAIFDVMLGDDDSRDDEEGETDPF